MANYPGAQTAIMELERRVPAAVVEMIDHEGLPSEDLNSADWFSLLGYTDGGNLAAVAGLERCGRELLLRSVVTSPACRRKGYAGALIEQLHQLAAEAGYSRVHLLTLDADRYFHERHGYHTIGRDQVPPGIGGSTQFSSLCPASATLMIRYLGVSG